MKELVGFFIAILLGALIGLQREREQHRTKIIRFAGFRTFVLISLLGSIIAYFSINIFNNFSLVIVGLSGIFILALSSYIVTYFKYKDTTATTEISSVLVFILGVMCVSGFLKEAVVIGIIVMALLTFRESLHHFAERINQKELTAIVNFAILSLVIFPFLPNKNYSLLDIPLLRDILLSFNISRDFLMNLNVFNPHLIWFVIILVAGIGLGGYILVKFFGTKKGYYLTGLVGGVASSTAVNFSMSKESKQKKKYIKILVLTAIIATSVSFIRVFAEVCIINSGLAGRLILPLGLMGLSGFLISAVLLFGKKQTTNIKDIEVKQPFAIKPAIKFGLFFGLILFVSKIALILAGSKGVYFASVLSGLADVDVIVLTMSSLSKIGEISSQIAITSIILAVSANVLAKSGIAWIFGYKKYAVYISLISLLILLVGLSFVFIF